MSDEIIEKLIYLGQEYAKRGWVWQLHIGAMRNNNTRMFLKNWVQTPALILLTIFGLQKGFLKF